MGHMVAPLVLTLLLAQAGVSPEQRWTYHRVTNATSPAPEPGAEREKIPSLAERLRSQRDWQRRRNDLLRDWTAILGKLEPSPADRRWFTDVRRARLLSEETREGYRRIVLELPLEKDFWQPHLVLIPTGEFRGRRPAVIAWTSTTPDWQMPEQWWGAWLARHGFVVLCGWSHLRRYRDGASYSHGVPERVYERFGRWAGMSRMVWDVRQQARFLRSRKDVDARRLGFIGFSLSGKTALYVAAFAPEIAATVSIDPHIAINGGTNWFAPWYLDWTRPFPDISTPSHTVLGLLKGTRTAPGFEHDHHEILALAAPRPLLIIGGSLSEDAGGDSDDLESWGYVNRAREVYRLLGVEDRLQFVLTGDGHHANGPRIGPAWQQFLLHWLASK
jgi:hypothetical protein